MTSERMRDNPLFMRNEFATVGRWEIPLIHKQTLDTSNIKLVACSDTRANNRPENTQKAFIFSWMTTVLAEYTIIQSAHYPDIHNMPSCFLPIFPLIVI